MYCIGQQRFDLVRCPCGLVYVHPRPDPTTIEWMYADPAYYTEGYNLGVETENYFTRREELVAQYEAEAHTLARETGGTGRLFEIGAAGGFFLEGARRAGFVVRGAELSPGAVEYARRELALDVFDGPFEAAGVEAQSQDVIVADNVLEHAPDPRSLVRSIHAALRPGGHFLVIVPSYVNSPYFRCLDRARRLVPRALLGAELARILKIEGEDAERHPYHLLEFDRRTLGRMLAGEGFMYLVWGVLVIMLIAAAPQIALFALFAGYALSGVVMFVFGLARRAVRREAAPERLPVDLKD